MCRRIPHPTRRPATSQTSVPWGPRSVQYGTSRKSPSTIIKTQQNQWVQTGRKIPRDQIESEQWKMRAMGDAQKRLKVLVQIGGVNVQVLSHPQQSGGFLERFSRNGVPDAVVVSIFSIRWSSPRGVGRSRRFGPDR